MDATLIEVNLLPARRPTEDAPSPRHAWIAACRPKTLGAAIAPVLVGTGLAAADQALHLPAALAALAGALLIQIGTNLANDYFDWRSGADTAQRLGPPRATQRGWIKPSRVAAGAALAFTFAAIVGIYLVARGGWPVVAIGTLGILCGVAYTGGPLPLGYFGLGDLAVLLFFGPVAVGGTYYVQALHVTSACWWAAIAIGAPITAILVVNNIRDRHTDGAAGKHTLAVRFGLRASRVEYALLVLLPYALLPTAVLLRVGTLGWLLPLTSLPLAALQLRRVWTRDGAQLNPDLGATARLALIFGILLTLGALL